MAEFRMPSLGADMTEGTLTEWLIAPGHEVHRGDVIAVVDTEKAAIEVECFDDGVLGELLVPVGQKVPVGTPLAIIEPAGAVPPAAVARAPVSSALAPAAPVPAAAVPSAAAPAAAAHRVTSPLVRQLAAQRGVDLAAVPASGPGGIVHRADLPPAAAPPAPAPPIPAPPRHRPLRASPLARHLASTAGLDIAEVAGTGRDGAVSADDVRAAIAARRPSRHPAVRAGARAPTRTGALRAEAMRHAIAERVAESNREIPHYYLTRAIDLSAATGWLRERNRQLPVAERIVPAALLLAATARAAVDVPQLNGHWRDGAFAPASRVDLGLVISLREGGIIVPVLIGAAVRGVEEIMAAVRDLTGRARAGRLRSSDMGEPTLTVSNLGDQGVDSVLGVILPPQVALVGFGTVLDRPWAVDGLLGVRPVVVASLAADHRVTDGAIGARFLNHLDRLLQEPGAL